MTNSQGALAIAEPQTALAPASPMQMIQKALDAALSTGNGLAVANLILDQMKEQRDYEDRLAFNGALARVQAQARRVRPTSENPQTRSRYANFAALDNELRPLYVAERLALSFDTAEANKPDTVRVVCDVSLGGYSRQYHIDMPADGKGAKGNDVMTKTHATGSAVSYGKRYLLLMIFNLSVGENDDDGNAAGGNPNGMAPDVLQGWIEKMRGASDPGQLATVYREAYTVASNISDKAAMFDLIKTHREEKARYKS